MISYKKKNKPKTVTDVCLTESISTAHTINHQWVYDSKFFF